MPEGIFPEIYARLSELSGLKFRFVPLPEKGCAGSMMREKKIDIMSGVVTDPIWAATQGIHLSRPCLTIPLVMVSNMWPDDDDKHLVVLPEGSSLTPFVYRRFATPTLSFLPAVRDCFDAVHTGAAEYTFANSYQAREMLTAPQYKNLHAVGFGGEVKMSVGIRDDMDPRLLSIINKSLNCIGKEEMTDIVLRHTVQFMPPSLKDIIYQHPLESISVAVLIAAIIIALLLGLVVSGRRAARRISDMVNKDELTGVWSFTRFRREAGEKLRQGPHQPLALVYFNISKFKILNATYGYAAGDAVLRFICTQLLHRLHASEMLGRVHSDHFVCLMEYPCRELFEQRMRQILEELSPKEDERFDLNFTMGVYPLQAGDTDINVIIDRANHARGQCVVGFTSSMMLYDDALLSQLMLEKDVERALKQAARTNEFLAYFQPKVDCRSGLTVGAEALVRWQREDGTLVSPALFIPLCEKNGFITQLDFMVLRKVCAQLASWQAEGLPLVPVSCNFSRAHLANEHFVDKLTDIVDAAGIARRYVEVEVTESVAMESLDTVKLQFGRLKKAGFSIAIDDFGTGYSSLSILTKLPVDVIKIDRSFIMGLESNPNSRKLLAGIVSIVHSLGQNIVCEGVERAAQLVPLREMDCTIIQGFCYGRPMPPQEFEAFVRAGAHQPAE